jgi:hypothetical protein
MYGFHPCSQISFELISTWISQISMYALPFKLMRVLFIYIFFFSILDITLLSNLKHMLYNGARPKGAGQS